MFNISNFLDKFTSLLKTSGALKEVAREIIKKVTNIDVELKDMTIRNGVLNIAGSSSLKSVLFIKKSAILKELKENPATSSIRDIR